MRLQTDSIVGGQPDHVSVCSSLADPIKSCMLKHTYLNTVVPDRGSVRRHTSHLGGLYAYIKAS